MNKKLIGIAAASLLIIGGAAGAFHAFAQSDDAAAMISAEEAQQIAEEEIGATASSVAVEQEDGMTVYEVQVGGQEVEVDAESGAILEIEPADSDFELFDFDD